MAGGFLKTRVPAIIKVVSVTVGLKALLFGALFASGHIWDTSTELLLADELRTGGWTTRLASRLMIWDNVHFIALAKNGGPRFEHEFAFSNAWGSLVRFLSPDSSLTSLALTSSLISLLSHLAACCGLYYLTEIRQLRGIDPSVAAILYSLCPAGIFLVSGYTESTFALLGFLGLLMFLKYRLYTVSGVLFALSLQLRSNGLLWGVLFVVSLLGEFLRKPVHLANIFGIILGGSLLAASFVIPQIQTYLTYCPQLAWCNARIPSIYTYVQSHYWNNGFLKYWTIPNIPNFALAAPTLILLVQSSKFLYKQHLVGLALAQSITVVAALLFWHIQIITRVASCFPGPYWYLASLFTSRDPKKRTRAKQWIWFLIVWNMTQAALYGAFLPPA